MTTLRVKIKLGENEFEADGPRDAVEAQVAAFARLLGREDKTPAEDISPPPAIEHLYRVNGTVLSMKLKPQRLDHAVLSLMIGQQHLRNNTAISGTQIMQGLRASGHHVERADHILKKFARDGDVVTTGRRRQRRYRLTTDGFHKAQQIAQVLAASVPQ